MNVLLVSANTEALKMPTLPLGLSLVAAGVRRAGHQTAFLDLALARQGARNSATTSFTPQEIYRCRVTTHTLIWMLLAVLI